MSLLKYKKILLTYVDIVRLIKRRFTKDPVIKDRAEGCQEVLQWSLVKYMWTFE